MPRRFALHTTLRFSAGDSAEHEVDAVVTYSYTAGRPEQGPTHDSGGEPAEPAEVEIENVEVKGPDTYLPVPQWMLDALQTDDELLGQCAMDGDDRYDEHPDPDAANDAARDDEPLRRQEAAYFDEVEEVAGE